MAVRTDNVEPSLVDSLCSRVRERVEGADAEQVEEFVRQYYRWVPAEDMAEYFCQDNRPRQDS